MVRSAVTISLVSQVRSGGPFVLWDSLAEGCATAAKLGYDGVEVFAPNAEAVDTKQLKGLLEEHGLSLAAVGTGAGMVLGGLSLTDPDEGARSRAIEFVKSIIDLGGPFGAPAIIGSMQGRWGDGLSRDEALGYLGEALRRLGDHAQQHGVPLVYEPLNRYETNLINTTGEAARFLESLGDPNVTILSDLFHMNIEETNIAEGLRAGGRHVGHVHFVDTNRRPASCGHMDYGPIVQALNDIGYTGYLSAEALPYPDPFAAAETTIRQFRELFVR